MVNIRINYTKLQNFLTIQSPDSIGHNHNHVKSHPQRVSVAESMVTLYLKMPTPRNQLRNCKSISVLSEWASQEKSYDVRECRATNHCKPTLRNFASLSVCKENRPSLLHICSVFHSLKKNGCTSKFWYAKMLTGQLKRHKNKHRIASFLAPAYVARLEW